MLIFFLLVCCIFSAAVVQAAQTCKPDFIPASTPDSQLTDNGDGTVTDLKTGLMWKQCVEGVSGVSCEIGSPSSFTWQAALEQPVIVNSGGGFAGYTDWRLANIRELLSIVEEQCCSPAINLSRFPNTPSSYPSSYVWSGSPVADKMYSAWFLNFSAGFSDSVVVRSDNHYTVRLVRGGN